MLSESELSSPDAKGKTDRNLPERSLWSVYFIKTACNASRQELLNENLK